MVSTNHPDYAHLGPFSDLVAVAGSARPLFPVPASPEETRRKAREVFRFGVGDEQPSDPAVERTWERDGVAGEEVSWSVGFGPRTRALVLRPAGQGGPLPGVLALHDHGHFKFFGKEKIADGPDGPPPSVLTFRQTYYGGRAYADALAREGYVVVAHDVFLWGSRKFPLEAMSPPELALADPVGAMFGEILGDGDVLHYNSAAYLHEHVVGKYCNVLGTSFAAIAAFEDRVAMTYLRSRPDVDLDRVACVGFSGGGGRAALFQATAERPVPCVVAGATSTCAEMFDHCIAPHSWLSFPPGWSTQGDWSDLAAAGAPAPLLVQSLLGETQFTEAGMRAADARIAAGYGCAPPGAYTGEFYPGPHRFDEPLQELAFAWLGRVLAR